MSTSRKIMMDFAQADFEKAKSMVRVGFELETQSKHCECTCTEEIDEDATDEACDENFQELMNELPDWISGHSKVWDLLAELAQEIARENTNPIFYSECQGTCDSDFDIPEVECGQDGSVRGHEFRTIGGLEYPLFVDKAERLFEFLGDRLEVDTGCSFHIHISLPGVRHSYGVEFQSSILEYLMKADLPECIKARLKDDRKRGEYFSVQSNDNKYRAVAHRGNTWEFRLFGNVSNSDDAKKCLDIAIAAFQFAYQVKFGLAASAGVIFKDDSSVICIKEDGTEFPVSELVDAEKTMIFAAEGL